MHAPTEHQRDGIALVQDGPVTGLEGDLGPDPRELVVPPAQGACIIHMVCVQHLLSERLRLSA